MNVAIKPHEPYVRRMTPRQWVARIAVYAVLIVAAIGFLVPLAAMVFTSLKSMPEIT